MDQINLKGKEHQDNHMTLKGKLQTSGDTIRNQWTETDISTTGY